MTSTTRTPPRDRHFLWSHKCLLYRGFTVISSCEGTLNLMRRYSQCFLFMLILVSVRYQELMYQSITSLNTPPSPTGRLPGFCKGSHGSRDLYQPKFQNRSIHIRYKLNLYKCFSSSTPTVDQFWNLLFQFAGVMLNIR